MVDKYCKLLLTNIVCALHELCGGVCEDRVFRACCGASVLLVDLHNSKSKMAPKSQTSFNRHFFKLSLRLKTSYASSQQSDVCLLHILEVLWRFFCVSTIAANTKILPPRSLWDVQGLTSNLQRHKKCFCGLEKCRLG